jgi:hypothetical protein
MALSVDLKGFPGVIGAVVADGNQVGSWSETGIRRWASSGRTQSPDDVVRRRRAKAAIGPVAVIRQRSQVDI